jgi:hypothetical protein
MIGVVLLTASATTVATYGYWSKSHSNCGPSNPPSGGGDCVVSWDFTDNATAHAGDPLPTYPGSDPAYSLVVQGFTVGRAKDDWGNPLAYSGVVGDSPNDNNPEATQNTGTYATDWDGSTYGIGVHAPNEGTHWGTKIDNKKNDSQSMYLRDAILMDFENCVVSIDEIGLHKVLDTDFQLWAFAGEIDPNQDLSQFVNYNDWTASGADADGWELVSQNWSSSRVNESVATINSEVTSRYFALIAGGSKYDKGDAFRMLNLTVSCDPDDCAPPGGSGVPAPGTLALLGIGAVAARRRFGRPS